MSSILINLVVDRSGSMASVVDDAQGALDSFIKEQKEVEGEAVLSYYSFDDTPEVVFEGRNLAHIEPGEVRIVPRGMTALHDAVGLALGRAEKLVHDALFKPDKVLFVVVTDGYENSSKNWTARGVNDRISWLRREKEWEFVFLAAHQDAWSVGHGLGIRNNLAFANDKAGYNQMSTTLSTSTATYRGGSVNVTEDFFTPSDK